MNASASAIVPSEASVPTIPTVKKPRGRPRKSDSDDSSKMPSTDKKKRGQPAKKQVQMSPFSIATSLISLRNGGSDPKIVIATASSDESDCQDWKCGFCGKMVDQAKVRCGSCRRWKGGKRDKKWSFKHKDAAETVLESEVGKKSKSASVKKRGGRPLHAARDAYARLTQADLDLQSEGIIKSSSHVSDGDVRPEVESVLHQMLAAVSEAGAKKKRRRKSKVDGEPDEKKKRKRSEKKALDERKVSVVTVGEEVVKQDVVEEAAGEVQDAQAPFAFESLCHIATLHFNDDEAAPETIASF